MYKILFVEDKKELCQEVAKWLGYEGYEVYTAYNAKEALRLALEKTPDMIISDILMPGMNGYDFFLELKKRENARLIPFIFLTALSDNAYIRKGMSYGADDYLTKPFSRKDLLEAIQTQKRKKQFFTQNTESSLKQLRNRIITTLPHELRTPLIGILGFGEILAGYQGNLSDEEIAEMGESILISGKRLHRIIENYLLYVQLELSDQNKQGITSGEILEALIFSECFSVAKNHQRESNLKTSIMPADLLIAEDFLRKILRELVDNAFRYSSETTHVEISGKVSGRKYLLSVKDNGIGFERNDTNNIGAFVQFNRKKNEQQGLGLGLAIVKRMTELSGGQFNVDSKPGHGTVVTCTFQLRSAKG